MSSNQLNRKARRRLSAISHSRMEPGVQDKSDSTLKTVARQLIRKSRSGVQYKKTILVLIKK